MGKQRQEGTPFRISQAGYAAGLPVRTAVLSDGPDRGTDRPEL